MLKMGKWIKSQNWESILTFYRFFNVTVISTEHFEYQSSVPATVTICSEDLRMVEVWLARSLLLPQVAEIETARLFLLTFWTQREYEMVHNT